LINPLSRRFYHLSFCLHTKRNKKVKAAILFLETLVTAPAPYPNSQTPLAEAQLPMAELRQGCGGLALVPEFLQNKIKAVDWLPTSAFS